MVDEPPSANSTWIVCRPLEIDAMSSGLLPRSLSSTKTVPGDADWTFFEVGAYRVFRGLPA
jgi:hypothetical protein